MTDSAIVIREEGPDDRAGIRRVHIDAFPTPVEADIVERLPENGHAVLSVVAGRDRELVGHVAFSPVTITDEGTRTEALGLGPMAVSRTDQRQGIGARLLRFGLDLLRKRGHRIVVVLGHPEYYPRFGFERGSAYGIRWEHDAPDDAFLVLGLEAGALSGIHGVVRYGPEFDDA